MLLSSLGFRVCVKKKVLLIVNIIISLRAVLLPYCKLELALFVANHTREAFKYGATIS